LSFFLAALVALGGLAVLTSPAVADSLQPGEGNWTRLEAVPFDNWTLGYAGMASFPDGRVVVAGTYGGKAAVFDPGTNVMRPLPDMPSARPSPAVVALADGRIAVFGGYNPDPNHPNRPGGEVYDPATDDWQPITDAPAFYGNTGTAELPDGRVLVASTGVNAVWTPTTGTFEPVGGDVNAGALLVTDAGRVLRLDYGDAHNGSLAELDQQDLTWHRVATLPIGYPLTGAFVQVDHDHALAVGADPATTWRGKAVVIDLTDLSMVDASPFADRPANENTQICAAGALPNGTPLALGCRGGYEGMAAFDPATQSWQTLPNASPVNSWSPTLTTAVGMYAFADGRLVRYASGSRVLRAPDAPTLHLQPCCSQGVRLQWDALDLWHDGGAPVTSYRITRSGPDGDVEFTTDQTTFTDPDVTVGGEYTYTVRGVNSVGAGQGAVWLAEVGDLPSPIQNLAADGNGKVVVTWDPPESSGGSPIVAYDIIRIDKYDGTGPTDTVDGYARRYVDTDVVVGQNYTYYVIPRNADGYDALSSGRYDDLRSVSVTVREANDGSTVATDSYQIVRGDERLQVDAHDTDGDPLTFHVTSGPNHGTLSGDYPDITYHPTPGYMGRDTISYKVTSQGAFATATITLSVREPLVVTGDGWTQTTIHDIDNWDQMAPYSVAADGQGTAYFPVVDTTTGTGSLVAQPRGGAETPTTWTVDPWYVNFPISLDTDAAGNVYGIAYVDGDRYWPRVLRPGGGQPRDLPFPEIRLHQSYTFPQIATSASGDVAISDPYAQKIYVLRAGAAEATTLSLPNGFYPLDLDLGPGNALYVVGSSVENNQQRTDVLRMDLDGGNRQLTRVDGWGIGIAVADDGTIYLAGAGTGATHMGISRMDPDGTMTSVSGPLELYTSGNNFDVDHNGSVYVPEIWGDRVVRIDFASRNAPPVVADSQRSVRGDQSSGLVLSASDPDGDPLTYTVTTGPEHGTLTGTAPDLTYTPDAGYTGPDSIGYSVDDGNGGTADATVSITVTDPETGTASVSQPVVEGQTVSTGAQPTADEPTQTAVTTPVAGEVTITQDPTVADPTGYSVVGAQYRIEAPQASAQEPLRLQFQIAEDQLPAGQTADDVEVFRDGVVIAACADDSGTANPDPCIASRATADGVVTITVLSSHASAWTLAVQQRATTTTVAPIAPSTYGQAIDLTATVAQAGSVPATGTVEFSDTSASPAKVLGSAPVGADGRAVLTGVRLDAGNHAIVATYSGSALSLPSASAPVSASVARAALVMRTRASSSLLSVLTFRITYSTTVVSAVTGDPVAGVPVTTRINGGAATTGCTAVTNVSGVATCSAGPVNIAIGGSFTAKAGATANYEAATATGKVPLL
jgi:hypothetical protein